MRGGFKSEERITELLQQNKIFADPRSAVVRDSDLNPHLILHGEDMVQQRAAVNRRDRGRCKVQHEGCTKVATDLEHEIGGGYRRCDCRHNLRMCCGNCQEKEHARTIRSGKVP